MKINAVPFRAIRLLDLAMTLAVAVFAIGSLIAIAMTPQTLGSGGVGINAVVDRDAGDTARRALAREIPARVQDSELRANLRVPKSDRDTRVVLASGVLVAIALVWVGLLSLRGVVRSAKDGDPFAARNVARLRMLGAALFALPILMTVCNRLVESTFSVASVQPYVARFDSTPIFLAALGAFALAEVFREGASLRELEQSTI